MSTLFPSVVDYDKSTTITTSTINNTSNSNTMISSYVVANNVSSNYNFSKKMELKQQQQQDAVGSGGGDEEPEQSRTIACNTGLESNNMLFCDYPSKSLTCNGPISWQVTPPSEKKVGTNNILSPDDTSLSELLAVTSSSSSGVVDSATVDEICKKFSSTDTMMLTSSGNCFTNNLSSKQSFNFDSYYHYMNNIQQQQKFDDNNKLHHQQSVDRSMASPHLPSSNTIHSVDNIDLAFGFASNNVAPQRYEQTMKKEHYLQHQTERCNSDEQRVPPMANSSQLPQQSRNVTTATAYHEQKQAQVPNLNKYITYFHILQQLLFDGHIDIAKMLLNQRDIPDANKLVPSEFLETMIAQIVKDFYQKCMPMQPIQHQQSISQEHLNGAAASFQMQPPMHNRTATTGDSTRNAVRSDFAQPTNHAYAMSQRHSAANFENALSQASLSGSGGGDGGGDYDNDYDADSNPDDATVIHHSPSPDSGDGKQSLPITCKFGSIGNGAGHLNMPHGFCIGYSDNIVIADTNNHRISVFDVDGNFLFCFGEKGTNDGQLYLPRKVAMLPPNIISDQDQEPVYVVCDRGAKRSRMQIFSLRGDFIRGIPIVYIDIVSGLCTTQDRKIVVVDSVRSGVSVLNEFGVLLFWFTCASEMIEPSDVAVHQQHYYVCDFKGHCVNVFNRHGVLIRKIGNYQLTKFPNGIDISDMGDILVGDSHGNYFHVTLFSPAGQLLGNFYCPFLKVSRCCGLKISSKGHIVTLAKNNNHVLVLNTINVSQNQPQLEDSVSPRPQSQGVWKN